MQYDPSSQARSSGQQAVNWFVAPRYHVREGIIIRRNELPSGDVVVTLFSEDGKWRGLARKGKIPGGNLGRLSLFHDVLLQYYLKRDEDLPLITQVQLTGALSRLSAPEVYPYAHLIAELTDKLTADMHGGEAMHGYLAAGLRGLATHADPEAVALTITWKLLKQAGLAPRLQACVHCGRSPVGTHFDVAAGGMSCESCQSGIYLNEKTREELLRLVIGTVREALEGELTDRKLHWRLLSRYLSYHVGSVSSLRALPQASEEAAAG